MMPLHCVTRLNCFTDVTHMRSTSQDLEQTTLKLIEMIEVGGETHEYFDKTIKQL